MPVLTAEAVPMTRAPRALASCTAKLPTPPAGGVNQHGLTGLQVRGVHQRLPGGQRRQRHGGGVDMVQRGGFVGDFAGLDGDVFGVSAVADDVGPSVDFIADRERADFGSDLDHLAGDVPAEGQGQAMVQELLQIAFPDFPIHRVDRRRPNPDQEIVGFEGR
jgi:hypothetical protein